MQQQQQTCKSVLVPKGMQLALESQWNNRGSGPLDPSGVWNVEAVGFKVVHLRGQRASQRRNPFVWGTHTKAWTASAACPVRHDNAALGVLAGHGCVLRAWHGRVGLGRQRDPSLGQGKNYSCSPNDR